MVGSSEKVVGLMVLTSFKIESDLLNSSNDDCSQSCPRPFPFSKKNIKQSKLQKKLSGFTQKKSSTFSMVSNSRARKIFPILSKVVGEFVEVIEKSKKLKQLILIHERMIDSLHILDPQTITYLYPQIELNFIVNDTPKENEETKPFTCFFFCTKKRLLDNSKLGI